MFNIILEGGNKIKCFQKKTVHGQWIVINPSINLETWSLDRVLPSRFAQSNPERVSV